jgi:hypothetical protein
MVWVLLWCCVCGLYLVEVIFNVMVSVLMCVSRV